MPHTDFSEFCNHIDRVLKDYYTYSIWKRPDNNVEKKTSTLDCFVREAFGPEAEGGTLEFMDTEGLSCVVICEKQPISNRIIKRVTEYYTPATTNTFRPRGLMAYETSVTDYPGVNNALNSFMDSNYIGTSTDIMYYMLTSGIFLCPVAPENIDNNNISLQFVHDTVRFAALLPFLLSLHGKGPNLTKDFRAPYSKIGLKTGKISWCDEDDQPDTVQALKDLTASLNLKHWCIFVILPYDSFETMQGLVAGVAQPSYIKRIIRIEEYPALLKDKVHQANNDKEKVSATINSFLEYVKDDKDLLKFHLDFLLQYNNSHIISPEMR